MRADADRNVVGASVSLDGQLKGQVPILISTVTGRHLVELRKDGFEPLSQWIDVQGDAVVLTPTLKEIAKYGSVLVNANVPDAEVYIDDVKIPDTTPIIIGNLVEGVHVIEVRKPPAAPWKRTVTIRANSQEKVTAELATRNPTGVVRVLSDTPGARAFIDGSDMGPVPVDIKDIRIGEHILQVKAPGFQTGEQRLTISAGSSQIVKLELVGEVASSQGSIKVIARVPDAVVFIDGAPIGKVPQEKRVPAGEHYVVVQLPGYKKFEQTVRIVNGQTQTVFAELKAVATLRVLSNPRGARVQINGFFRGNTPFEGEVAAGPTIVRLELSGFEAFEETVALEGGKSATISRELAPRARR